MLALGRQLADHADMEGQVGRLGELGHSNSRQSWIYLDIPGARIFFNRSNFLVMVPKLGRIGDFNRTDSASHSSG